MIKKLLLLSFLVSSFSVFAAAAGEMSEAKPMKRGDAEKGSKLVGTCVACHGVDGNSVVGQWPTLAGQRESYLFEQLEHIRDEERVIAVMKGLLNNYSDDDLRDMAAFYASQKTKVGQADETNLELGQQIYRAGNLASGVPACTGCHGPAGKGLRVSAISNAWWSKGRICSHKFDCLSNWRESYRRTWQNHARNSFKTYHRRD